MTQDNVTNNPDLEEVIDNFKRKNGLRKNETNFFRGRIDHSIAAELVKKKTSEIDLKQISFEEYFSSRIWRINAPWILSDILKLGITVSKPIYRVNFECRKLYRDFSNFVMDIVDPYNGISGC